MPVSDFFLENKVTFTFMSDIMHQGSYGHRKRILQTLQFQDFIVYL